MVEIPPKWFKYVEMTLNFLVRKISRDKGRLKKTIKKILEET